MGYLWGSTGSWFTGSIKTYIKWRKMKRIVTVQDMIDELMLVVNKDAEINIVMNTGDYQTEYIPDLYDFSVIDFTDVHPDDGNSENKVVIEMCR